MVYGGYPRGLAFLIPGLAFPSFLCRLSFVPLVLFLSYSIILGRYSLPASWEKNVWMIKFWHLSCLKMSLVFSFFLLSISLFLLYWRLSHLLSFLKHTFSFIGLLVSEDSILWDPILFMDVAFFYCLQFVNDSFKVS